VSLPDDGLLPNKSRGIFSDLKAFWFTRPPIPTLVEIPSVHERMDYTKRILQRLAIDFDQFSVLNIHQIGIDVPVKYVFEEFFSEDVEARCWPDHFATQHRQREGVEEIDVVVCGRMRRFYALARSLFGQRFGTLFRMTLLRAQHVPNPSDFDNARYLLYSSGGGYPVGVVGIYVRSTIPGRGERGISQFFFVVGFNFYGRRAWPGIRAVNRLWESVHNRVTVNVLNRFKRLCEGRFEEMRRGFEAVLGGGAEGVAETISGRTLSESSR